MSDNVRPYNLDILCKINKNVKIFLKGACCHLLMLYTPSTDFTKKRSAIIMNITGYLKNHWTISRLVCTHLDAFSMLIPSMDTKFMVLEIFQHLKIYHKWNMSSANEIS